MTLTGKVSVNIWPLKVLNLFACPLIEKVTFGTAIWNLLTRGGCSTANPNKSRTSLLWTWVPRLYRQYPWMREGRRWCWWSGWSLEHARVFHIHIPCMSQQHLRVQFSHLQREGMKPDCLRCHPALTFTGNSRDGNIPAFRFQTPLKLLPF